MTETLIDPPVTPHSPVAEIEAWIEELQDMEPNDDVKRALAQAQRWLASAKSREGA